MAEELWEEMMGSANARELVLESVADQNPVSLTFLDVLNPKTLQERMKNSEDNGAQWFNYESLLYTLTGVGFIALYDDGIVGSSSPTQKSIDEITKVFSTGSSYGIERASQNLRANLPLLDKILR